MTNTYPYEATVDATAVNMKADKIAKAAKLFLSQQTAGKFPGGQLVVRRHGKCVLRLSCGASRGWQQRGGNQLTSVQDTTPFPVYSAGKALAAIVIAMLESKNLLDIHTPIASTLPEFGSMGRDKITTYDVLTHRAGILLKDVSDQNILSDQTRAWQYLLTIAPTYPRGTFAYMPGEYGIILEQICITLTGQNMASYFDEQLAQPLGLNNISYGLGKHQHQDLAWTYWLGGKRCMIAGINIAERFEEKNNALQMFSAANPAFGMIADASNLAAIYEFLVNRGKDIHEKQLIPAELIQRYTQHEASGWNKSVNAYLSLSRGFMLGTTAPSFYGWWGTSKCFGHPGMFSTVAFADPDRALSIAIVTNGNRGITDFFKRTAPLAHTLRSACS